MTTYPNNSTEVTAERQADSDAVTAWMAKPRASPHGRAFAMRPAFIAGRKSIP
jgi:hypothetical protein